MNKSIVEGFLSNVGDLNRWKLGEVIYNSSAGLHGTIILDIFPPETESEYANKQYIIKCISAPETINRYIEPEINLMNSLTNSESEGVVRYVKYHLQRNQYSCILLIVMEKYVTLADMLCNNDFSVFDEGKVLKILHDTLIGLISCHKHNIAHRDIKPENIFFDGQNYLIGDFGISRKLSENEFLSKNSAGFYTPKYAPPEVFDVRKEAVNPFLADIYSFGLIAYLLYDGLKPEELPDGESRRLNPDMNIRAPEYADKAISEIIMKAIAFEPESRYGSFYYLYSDFRKASNCFAKLCENDRIDFDNVVFADFDRTVRSDKVSTPKDKISDILIAYAKQVKAGNCSSSETERLFEAKQIADNINLRENDRKLYNRIISCIIVDAKINGNRTLMDKFSNMKVKRF